ncbi:MAG TPA: hypothetical protein VFA77_02975 [Candidatus Eisenbacteria bacterium]|jgi:hypothetical protein|nr:hypothetical protein [Candidatus Eisenbacteria bacterium]
MGSNPMAISESTGGTDKFNGAIEMLEPAATPMAQNQHADG